MYNYETVVPHMIWLFEGINDELDEILAIISLTLGICNEPEFQVIELEILLLMNTFYDS
jgi:hypothetical protein